MNRNTRENRVTYVKRYEKNIMSPEQKNVDLLKRALKHIQCNLKELEEPVNFQVPVEECETLKELVRSVHNFTMNNRETDILRPPHHSFVAPFPPYAIERNYQPPNN